MAKNAVSITFNCHDGGDIGCDADECTLPKNYCKHYRNTRNKDMGERYMCDYMQRGCGLDMTCTNKTAQKEAIENLFKKK